MFIYLLQSNILFNLLPIRDIITLYNYKYGDTTNSNYNQITKHYELKLPINHNIYDYAILMAQISWN